ncbi:MAG: mycofactocin-associated electron transfer flavoprotein beta subunit [Acidimicrobiales bacterium]
MTAAPDTHDGPLVVACLRITDLRAEVDPLSGTVTRDVWGLGLSAPDAAALEHALRIAEAWSGRVLALAVGPASIEPVLRTAVALGATAVRVPTPEVGGDTAYAAELGGDERDLARTMVQALDPFGPITVVVCGDRSVDRGTGAIPAYLAHELDAVQALGLVSLRAGVPGDAEAPSDGDGRYLVAERRLDGGWREWLRVPVPAVCSVEGAGTRLRRASLTGALTAEAHPPFTAPVPAPDRATSGPDPLRVGPTRPFEPRPRVLPAPAGDARRRLLALTGALVAHHPPTVVGPVGAAEAADHLLGFLGRHGYLEGTSVTDGPGVGDGTDP